MRSRSPIVASGCPSRSKQVRVIAIRLLAGATVVAAAPSTMAQTWVTYDASLGTLPQAQCFPQFASAYATRASIVDGQLHFSTTDGVNGFKGTYLYWERDDITIDWSNGLAMEAQCTIVSSDDEFAGSCQCPRTGYGMTTSDQVGKWINLSLASNSIVLRNHPDIPVDGVNCRRLIFPVAGVERLYRVEINSNGADLFIDGVLQDLHIPLSASFTFSPNAFWFGDGTAWANGEAYTRVVQLNGASVCCAATPCPGDLDCDGVVGILDFLGLLASWGPCPPGGPASCPADLDGDGSVGVVDMLLLLAAWGRCQ